MIKYTKLPKGRLLTGKPGCGDDLNTGEPVSDDLSESEFVEEILKRAKEIDDGS